VGLEGVGKLKNTECHEVREVRLRISRHTIIPINVSYITAVIVLDYLMRLSRVQVRRLARNELEGIQKETVVA
jgi:hypothetical protein